uniref:Uncharacterized protein n=1 Tax=Panagrolaimus sp. PS1159 TaxID=55785 RepID=A0AC35FCV1_9BILA
MFSSRRSRNRHSANPNPKLHTGGPIHSRINLFRFSQLSTTNIKPSQAEILEAQSSFYGSSTATALSIPKPFPLKINNNNSLGLIGNNTMLPISMVNQPNFQNIQNIFQILQNRLQINALSAAIHSTRLPITTSSTK